MIDAFGVVATGFGVVLSDIDVIADDDDANPARPDWAGLEGHPDFLTVVLEATDLAAGRAALIELINRLPYGSTVRLRLIVAHDGHAPATKWQKRLAADVARRFTARVQIPSKRDAAGRLPARWREVTALTDELPSTRNLTEVLTGATLPYQVDPPQPPGAAAVRRELRAVTRPGGSATGPVVDVAHLADRLTDLFTAPADRPGLSVPASDLLLSLWRLRRDPVLVGKLLARLPTLPVLLDAAQARGRITPNTFALARLLVTSSPRPDAPSDPGRRRRGPRPRRPRRGHAGGG